MPSTCSPTSAPTSPTSTAPSASSSASSASPRPKASTTSRAFATRSPGSRWTIVALEMMVLRVLSAEKSGKQRLDVAGLLKIRGSEIQQRYSELMMLAAGPSAVPFDPARRWKPAGRATRRAARFVAPLAATYFNMRKTTIYGGVERSAAQHRRADRAGLNGEHEHGLRFHRRPGTCCATSVRKWVDKSYDFERRRRHRRRPAASSREAWTASWPSSA